MKRCLLFAMLLCASWGWAQSCPGGTPTTPNLGLYIPAQNSSNWGYCNNANYSSLDSLLSGLTALPGLKVNGTTTLQNVVINGTCTGAGCGAGSGVTAVTASGNIASSGGFTPNITFTGILPVANGGTGTATPGLVAGTNITLSGT